MQAVARITSSCNADACNLPVQFEQFVIVWHALELAIRVKDLDQVDMLWSRFINFSGVSGEKCNCG
jgi:hypothetical protein